MSVVSGIGIICVLFVFLFIGVLLGGAIALVIILTNRRKNNNKTYCSNCGAELPPDLDHCENCGVGVD